MNDPKLLSLAAGIVQRCDRDHPADAELRVALRAAHGLTRGDSARISRAVFAYFAWRGWLSEGVSTEAGIVEAHALAERYAAAQESFDDEALRARAVPPWVAETCEVGKQWVRTLQRKPVLWLRAKRGQGDALMEKLQWAKPGLLPDSMRYEWLDDLFRHPLFQAGEFEIQDIASQAVGLVCAPEPGETWWDACAGEGGKLLHLSDLMANKGLIWASDRAEWRLAKLKRRTARAKCFNYRAAPWDGGPRLPTKTKFNGVLLDAPCAGLGTWGRNPHARWTTTLNDVLELAGVQQRLLAHASQAVKPGGRLVYSVCTLSRQETEAVCDAFDQAHGSDFEPLAFPNVFSPEEAPQARQCWWPQQTRGNGMFVAQWRRK